MVKKEKPFIRQIPGFRSGKPKNMILAIAGYAFISIIILTLLFVERPEYEPQTSIQTESAPKTTHPSVGEEGILYVKESDIIVVSVDEAALEEFIEAALAGDEYGYTELVLTGKGFIVDSGTKVLVLKKSFPNTKVRVLEDENVGRSGWVPYEWVIKR